MTIGQPRQCSACGYDLAGLKSRGTCPECGAPFNTLSGEGIRGGRETLPREDRLLRRLRTISLAALAGFCLVCGGGLDYFAGHGSLLWTGVIFAVLALLAAITSYVYEKD